MFKQDIEGLNKHREQTIRDIKDLLQDNKRVACVRYTGYGKSYYIVRKLIEDVSGKVIIVVPNDTLKIHYEEQYKDNNKVIILTYQIIKNKTTDFIQENYRNVSLIIADECHHITSEKWTKEFQRLEKETGASVLGLTATPDRGNKVNVVDEFFNNVQVQPLDLLEGISLGFVPKIKYIVAYASLDDKQDIIDHKMTEVDRYKISNLLKVENIFKEEISDEYLKDNLKILVFVPRIVNIEEGRYKSLDWFKTIYPDKNINIYSISSKSKPNKNKIELNNFKELHDNNTIDIMVSVNKLIEGLHLPTVSIAILLRKTKSSVVYFQQIGRVINSKQPLVFDLINNTSCIAHIKHAHESNCSYVGNLNSFFKHRKKIMYDECIELIYKTKEIEDILRKYKYSAEDIILMNRNYIEENPDNLSENKMALKFDINVSSFRYNCKKLSIDLFTNYSITQNYGTNGEIVLYNKTYIEKNPDNLSRMKMSDSLGINYQTFISICKKLYIDLTTNYKCVYKDEDNPILKVLLDNKTYIEENPDNLTKLEMLTKFNFKSFFMFRVYCNKLNIDINTNYTVRNIKLRSRLLNEKIYIEENPDDLSLKAMSKYIGTTNNTFKKYCKKYNIHFKYYLNNDRSKLIEL